MNQRRKQRRKGRISEALRGGLGVVICCCLSGCANPGPPKPPSLHLARPTADLTAERTGDDVTLHWTTDSQTTDGVDVKGKVTAEICMEAGSTCSPVERVAVPVGSGSATVHLAGQMTVGPMVPVVYRVRLLNGAGRSAGLSNETLVAAGAAPPRVEGLKVSATKTGAMAEWSALPGAGAVELERRMASSGPAPVRAKAKDPFGGGREATEATEARLRVEQDVGGAIDHGAKMGETYSYTAQRVRTLTVYGKSAEVRSPASAAVMVTMRDVFPPAVPVGLEAVQGGPAAIDLSWEPVMDADLAGYRVYRQAVRPDGTPVGEWVKLTGLPIQAPGFRDATAAAGQRYVYRVSAVDAAGNESAPSATVEERIQEP